MPKSYSVSQAVNRFKEHYGARLAGVSLTFIKHHDLKLGIAIRSKDLRPDNYPMILSHGQRTADIIVLTHGLSDSPQYMLAIGKRFYRQGLNVILPLLPGHGLKDPDRAMEDRFLDDKWRQEIDLAVEVAHLLGDRVSLGGFSTGGALSLNKLLRDPKNIKGGLFLFSAALDLGSLIEYLSGVLGFRYILQSYLRVKDGVVAGTGLNPYKFPRLPKFAGPELGQIIVENEKFLKQWENVGKKITNPVFAAHSVHDKTVKIAGLLEVLKNHVNKGQACVISQNVSHSELVLAEDIPTGKANLKADKANPQFDWMMENAIHFFKKNVSFASNIAKNRNQSKES
jgi:pimeloyl-ACP methyl ester carboxylesterase